MKKFQTLALGVALAAVSVDLQAQIQHSAGAPGAFNFGPGQYWNNVSADNGTGVCNIGYFLTETFTEPRCNNESPATAWQNAGNKGITNSFANGTFTFAAGTYDITYFGRFAGMTGQTFTATDGVTSVSFNATTNYNTPTLGIFANSWWLVGNTGDPVGTSRSDQLSANGVSNWAAFLASDGSYYVGFEDEWNNPQQVIANFDYDYNDGIFRILQVPPRVVPEPMSLALLIPAFGALAFARRRRNV